MDKLQPVTSSLHNVQMLPVGSVSSMPASIQPLKSNEQMRIDDEQVTQYGDGPQNVSTNNSALNMMPRTNFSGYQQLTIPNNESGYVGAVFSNLKPQTIPMPVKRKSPMENLSAHLLSPRELMPNKKSGQLEHRPWLNFNSPNQSTAQPQVQSLAGVLASQQWAAKKKRTTKFQPGPPKSGFQMFPTPRSHPIQGHPSLRVQTDPNETVRSKFRESVSAALALVTEKEKSLSMKDTSTSGGELASEQMQEVSQSTEPVSYVTLAEPSVGKQNVTSEDCPAECENNMKSLHLLTAVPSDVSVSCLPQTHESVSHELNVIDMLPDEESITVAGNFFGKDDLLQGNGLSWVLDFDAWVAEKESQEPNKQNIGEMLDGAQKVKNTNSPQTLALRIELELFKLFDGVNKKYKEKARSLLFNLKDKNNPELREKVMAGEISPARLCSMSAEELASKELSEWRIAKAEEFEHMKILPDSDMDIRRLVKKTHKGEYQVEVEEDDVSVEVSVGSSSLPPIPAENKETKFQSEQISDGDQMETANDKNDSEEKNLCTITIPPNISSDLMQGINDDELKDAEFLPPIVSLDEFMESLHTEPPFENLSTDANKTAASLGNAHPEVPTEIKSAKLSPDGHSSATTMTGDSSDSKDLKLGTVTKPTDGQPETKVSGSVAVTKGEQIWEGILQLSNSSKVSVSCFFKSGEKASTKDWFRTIEIKGRVRLDAFEKFLHDLHKSRSRTVMVIHLILKENEVRESESLSQVVDSYVSDDRVGFAEPVRGLEAYLCPCHPKIIDRIVKHLAKEQSEALSLADGDKGLIGVVVWRKAHATPNSSSHHKHSLKKHQQEHNTSRRHSHQQDRNMNVNSSNLKPKHPTASFVSPKVAHSVPTKAAAAEDDLPPGFGPPAEQDDDDLPEFNFSSGLSRSVTTQKPVVAPQTQNRPADQMRQLIQKYGQNAGSGLVVKPWDDDDDDIPDWQPPQMLLPPAQPVHPTQHNSQQLNQPMLQHLINQQEQLLRSTLQQPQGPLLPQLPTPTIQQHIAPSWPQQQQQQQQQTGLWMNPQDPQQGQFYGTQNNRGF